jgi:hypothetical protein
MDIITIVQYPKRRVGLVAGLVISLVLNLGLLIGLRFAPVIRAALGFNAIEYVEEDYNRAILIDFSKGFHYPPGYAGFVAPRKVKSLEEIRREEARQARREEQRRRRLAAREREVEREKEESLAREKTRQEQETASAQATQSAAPRPDSGVPAGSGIPGGFGRINTAPIRDQVQRLYQASQTGLLVIPEGRLRVGATGSINPDGSLRNYRLLYRSGIPAIDASALAILEAVSESRALGPLHNLTSISLIIEVDQFAQLNVVGFAGNEDEARGIVDLANAALLFARIRKAQDPAAMTMLNNLKVSRSGQRVEAVIQVSRLTATSVLRQSLGGQQ